MKEATRLVQLRRGAHRHVARVDEPFLTILDNAGSVYDLARAAISLGRPLTEIVRDRAAASRVSYDEVYQGASQFRLLPPIDHPEPARCLVSGTGLTHLGSASSRAAMHAVSDADQTDSMRMFRAGLEGGHPPEGRCGAAPEWFYKGRGDVLCGNGEPLDVPEYAEDGGEEAEIAGVYVNGEDGMPWRVGMAAGNEFSDHRFEKRNYLNLAGSKLRRCAIGPELVVAPAFESVAGAVRIERRGDIIWQRAIATGEREMCHSLANLEHHHFKFEGHRRPGDVHVHFFGAHSLSFTDGVVLQNGDIMRVEFEGFGRALWNPVQIAGGEPRPVAVRGLS